MLPVWSHFRFPLFVQVNINDLAVKHNPRMSAVGQRNKHDWPSQGGLFKHYSIFNVITFSFIASVRDQSELAHEYIYFFYCLKTDWVNISTTGPFHKSTWMLMRKYPTTDLLDFPHCSPSPTATFPLTFMYFMCLVLEVSSNSPSIPSPPWASGSGRGLR